MKKIFKPLAFATLAACSSFACADLYVGASVGVTEIDLHGYDETTSYSITGGLDISQYFAVELSYIDLGDFDDDIAPVWTVSADGYNAAVVGRLPVTDQISLFAKFGAFAWEADLKEEGFGHLDDDEGVDYSAALGMNVALSPNLELNAQYMRIDMDITEVDNVSAGITFRF